MARSGRCRTCGARIRPRAKDMTVGAASRIHYWKHHPEVMLAGQAKRQWKGEGVRGAAGRSAEVPKSKRSMKGKRARRP